MIITFNSLLSLEKQNLSFLQHQEGFHLIVSLQSMEYFNTLYMYMLYIFL